RGEKWILEAIEGIKLQWFEVDEHSRSVLTWARKLPVKPKSTRAKKALVSGASVAPIEAEEPMLEPEDEEREASPSASSSAIESEN
ncbi:hypothetical protein AMTR_s00042p00174900, partial [Amborella trichopoda]